MVDYLQALLLAIVQGITEWLPVSSSAHLAILQKLLGVSPPISFDIALHMGTLASVVLYLRGDLAAIARNRDIRMLACIVVASVPTAIIGFALHDLFASFFSDISLVGAALLVTGTFLFLTRFAEEKSQLGPASAFVVGIAQGIAVAPGISRSGSTIGAGMLLGINRGEAARFSFLLSIPAIIGAAFFELRKTPITQIDAGPTALGALAAAAIGYASIGYLMAVIRKGDFSVFACYCWLAGILAIIYGLAG